MSSSDEIPPEVEEILRKAFRKAIEEEFLKVFWELMDEELTSIAAAMPRIEGRRDAAHRGPAVGRARAVEADRRGVRGEEPGMDEEPIDFAAEERVEMSKGAVFYGPAPFPMDRQHPEIKGRTVRIDGRLYTVLAVERHLVLRPIRVGESIGLLVREL